MPVLAFVSPPVPVIFAPMVLVVVPSTHTTPSASPKFNVPALGLPLTPRNRSPTRKNTPPLVTVSVRLVPMLLAGELFMYTVRNALTVASLVSNTLSTLTL